MRYVAVALLAVLVLSGCSTSSIKELALRAYDERQTYEQNKDAQKALEKAEAEKAAADKLAAEEAAREAQEEADRAEEAREAERIAKLPPRESWDATQLPPFFPIAQPMCGFIWKPVNHSGNGTAILFPKVYLGEDLGEPGRATWKAVVIATDPAGVNVLATCRRVAPYEGHTPIVRIDQPGSAFEPGPVYVVILYDNGARRPWVIPQPGKRQS